MDEKLILTAKFGDKFVTRSGNIAVFLERFYYSQDMLMSKNSEPFWDVKFAVSKHVDYADGDSKDYHYIIKTYEDGFVVSKDVREDNPEATTDDDIIMRYAEPIDEDKLSVIAEEGYCDTADKHATEMWREGFKAGYRYAKEVVDSIE